VTQPLRGVTVVVTRPAHQAGPLIESLEQQGAQVIAFPVIAVEPIFLGEETRARLAPSRFDWAIFTSANAVEQAIAQFARPWHCRIAAVGRATARALEQHGVEVAAVPTENASSEGLLALPELADVRGRRILIARGAGGRELLGSELAARGAIVEFAELYRRSPARIDADLLQRVTHALAGPVPAVLMMTSVEVLDAVLSLLPAGSRSAASAAPVVVPGERVARAVAERGFHGPVIVARSAEDPVMLAALREGLRNTGNPPGG
jgi:uroporphyrinogen-III synthase